MGVKKSTMLLKNTSLITLLLLPFVVSSTKVAQELVVDGGFENPSSFRITWNPTGWDYAGGKAEVTLEEAHSGGHSVKVTTPSYALWPSYVGIQQYFRPVDNREYVMTFWIKGTVPDRTDGEVEARPSSGGNDISLGIDSRNNTFPITAENGELIIQPGEYQDWTQVTYYWNSGTGNSDFSIDIGSYSNAGAVYYMDDFSIKAVEAVDSGGEDGGGVVDPGTMVADGGFENQLNFRNNWSPTYWDLAGGIAEVSPDESHSGNSSVKIQGASQMLWPSYVGVQQFISNPPDNTDYVMTFWVKGTVPDRTDGEIEATPPSGGNDISLGIDSMNNIPPITAENGELIIQPGVYNDWTQVTYYWNSGTDNRDFSIDIGSYTNSGAVYYLDDFAIEQTTFVKDLVTDDGFETELAIGLHWEFAWGQ